MPLAVDEGLAGFALRLQRIEFLLEPLLGGFAGVDRTADGSVPPRAAGRWLLHWPASATSDARARLLRPKNRGPDQCAPVIRSAITRQRPIALALVLEPVLAHEDGMGVSAPLPHQGRAGLQHDAGIEGTSAFLELSRQSLQAALQRAARAAMGALLQLIGEPPDDQIATEAQRRSGVMQCPPGKPQLLCRPIDQSGDFAIDLGQVRLS